MPIQPEKTVQPDRKLTLDLVLRELVKDRLIGREEAQKLHAERRTIRSEIHPLILVAEKKWKSGLPPHRLLTLESLTEWMAAKAGLGYLHIDPLKIDFSSVTSVISKAYAARFKVLPISVTPKEAVIATAEPFMTEWARELSKMLQLEIKLVMANPLDINRYISEFYNLASSVKRAIQVHGSELAGINNFEQLVELGKSGKLDANEAHVVHIVDWLWQYAFEQRASDIHLEPRRDAGVVRFRIDGVLHQVYQIPSAVMNAITSRIKLLGRMDVVEKRRPQDGRIKTKTPDGNEIELRLSTMPTVFGEKVVMRIFNPDVLVKDFAELGFSDEEVARWNKLIAKPNGIILVTGPTGSGKTTTLYSTLKQLAVPEVNVCTIEDPIEMVEPLFNQMQVVPSIGLEFSGGIRTLMRQDPDIIMVGEIRDLETAEMAIQAALTGHLVLSTLHTNDAPSAITRLLDLGVPSFLINATLLGVLAQRLVRTLCPHCKQRGELDEESWRWLVDPWNIAEAPQVYQAAGCLECRLTGYLGRTGLYEMMLMSSALKVLVTDTSDPAEIRKLAIKEGMKPLRISGAIKIADGNTTLDEVLKVAPTPESDRRAASGMTSARLS